MNIFKVRLLTKNGEIQMELIPASEPTQHVRTIYSLDRKLLLGH